jgi:hypothetical protein
MLGIQMCRQYVLLDTHTSHQTNILQVAQRYAILFASMLALIEDDDEPMLFTKCVLAQGFCPL